MQAFDGRKGKSLSYETRGSMRFFAFYLGNETILSGTKWGVHYAMDIVFDPPSNALGTIFALELFRNYGLDGSCQNNSSEMGTSLSATELIGTYIQSLNEKSAFDACSLDKLKSQNSKNWRDVMVRFFRDLGNRNLKTKPLEHYKSAEADEEDDYAIWIISEGGTLERTVAIFCNILRMDKDFNVVNEDWARYRTSQYIRSMNTAVEAYVLKPAFKEWETELWGLLKG